MTTLPQITPETHQRLQAVDSEMESIRTCKLHRTITMRHGDIRIEMFVNRDRSQHGYYGSCQFNDKNFSSWGKLPSEAVAKLVTQLRVEFAKIAARDIGQIYKGLVRKFYLNGGRHGYR